MKSQGLKVFLSYATRDGKFGQALRIELEKGGFEVWDPAAQLTPGDNWALEVGKALKDAEAMVVLLSPAALVSDHVKREIDFALSEPRFKGRLIPVVIRPVKEIPWILETLHVIRIDTDPERGSRRVLEALKRVGSTSAMAGVALTSREREIAQLVATGATNREIAKRLFVSEATVRAHLAALFKKFGQGRDVHSAVNLAATGATTREIAKKLSVTERTVKARLAEIFKGLGERRDARSTIA